MLRDYQTQAVADIEEAHQRVRSVLFTLPTGGGKTRIATEITARRVAQGERVWFVCHRREIIKQTSAAFDKAGIAHGIVGLGHPRAPDATVQVCSVATLARMTVLLAAPDLVIWDEAHHASAPGWARIKASFADAQHLGLTATPVRLDGRGLGDHFDELICGPSTSDLIATGYLSPFRAFVPSIPDLRKIERSGGDYKREALAERMGTAALVGDVIAHTLKLPTTTRAILFAVSVPIAQAYLRRFAEAGVSARLVTGQTPADERDAAIADLRDRRIRVLINVEVFTEGFDLPEIDAVILARPTQSFGLFRQMIGRALRRAVGAGLPTETASPITIHDHAGLIYTHGLPNEDIEWRLDGLDRRSPTTIEHRFFICPACNAVQGMLGLCINCGHECDVRMRSAEEIFGNLIELPSRRIKLPGSISQREFAAINKVNRSKVCSWIGKGMPVNIDKSIYPETAQPWVDSNFAVCGTIGMTRDDFARRNNVPYSTVTSWVGRGMPIKANGLIDDIQAQAWVDVNRPPKRTGTLTLKEFAAMHKIPPSRIRSFIKCGMPSESDGTINPILAASWVIENRKPLRGGTLRKADFARLRSVPSSRVHNWVKSGMPTEPDNSINPFKANPWLETHLSKPNVIAKTAK